MRFLLPAAVGAVVLAAAVAAPSASAIPAYSDPHTTIDLGDPALFNDPLVTSAGDVNGDGREDLLIQSDDPACEVHGAHIVFGSDQSGEVDLANLGARGIRLTGLSTCLNAYGVELLGDVNGDGKDDIGITSPRPIVVFGRSAGTVDVSDLGTGGLRFTDGGNVSVSRIGAVGDVNGDGRKDIGLGGTYAQMRPVAGVVFGRPQGGTIDLRTTTTAGFMVGDPTSSASGGPGLIRGVGDVNGDGRADVIAVLPGYEQMGVVLGRATTGFVDASKPGAMTRIGANPFLVGLVRPQRFEDINGDGIAELETEPGLASMSIFRGSRTAPYYNLSATAPRTEIRASLGFLGKYAYTGNVSGDASSDLLVQGLYPLRVGRWMPETSGGISLTYVVDRLTPGVVDLRTTTSGVRRLAVDVGLFAPQATLRFRGNARRQVAMIVGDKLLIRDLVEVPDPPADRTPPVLSSVRFEQPSISRCSTGNCMRATQTELRFDLSEPAYLDMQIRRGTTLVTSVRGSVLAGTLFGQPVEPPVWFFSAVERGVFSEDIVDRLPTGTYTATFKPTDLAGNAGATQTATIQVVN